MSPCYAGLYWDCWVVVKCSEIFRSPVRDPRLARFSTSWLSPSGSTDSPHINDFSRIVQRFLTAWMISNSSIDSTRAKDSSRIFDDSKRLERFSTAPWIPNSFTTFPYHRSARVWSSIDVQSKLTNCSLSARGNFKIFTLGLISYPLAARVFLILFLASCWSVFTLPSLPLLLKISIFLASVWQICLMPLAQSQLCSLLTIIVAPREKINLNASTECNYPERYLPHYVLMV